MTVAVEAPEETASSKRGDWRAIEAIYLQLSLLKKNGGPTPPSLPLVLDQLAEATAQVFSAYEGLEDVFLEHLRELMLRIDKPGWKPRLEFRNLCKDESLRRFDLFRRGDRPPPRPFEAAVETVRRLVDLNQLRSQFQEPQILRELETSAILGGSLSFGRFFSVYGEYSGRPSDIDLILLIPDFEDLEKVVDVLRAVHDQEGYHFIETQSLDEMEARARFFSSEFRREHGPIIFQHKLSLWPESPEKGYFKQFQYPLYYNLALHVMTVQEFKHISLEDCPKLDQIPEGPRRTVNVYRDDAPPEREEEQYCFAGFRDWSKVPAKAVRHGYLTTVQVCDIKDRRFYPGMHLNLLFPQFEVRWEAPRIPARLALQALRYKLLARLVDEKLSHERQVMKLSFAHARSERFSRRVRMRLDGD